MTDVPANPPPSYFHPKIECNENIGLLKRILERLFDIVQALLTGS